MAVFGGGGTGSSSNHLYITTGSTTTATNISTASTTAGIVYTGTGSGLTYVDDVDYREQLTVRNNKVKLREGLKAELPDGSVIDIDIDGNFEINDKNAKRVYKANRILEFNKYLNASDLLEAFIADLGKVNIRQGEVLAVPIELFINWLIHKAAEADNDPVPKGVPRLEDYNKARFRCKFCGRFLSNNMKNADMHFCNGEHYQRYLNAKS